MVVTKEERNRIVISLLPDIKRVASEIYKQLPENSSVEFDDLVNEGVLAVLRSFEHLKNGSIKGDKLTPQAKRYLLIRAKGAMFDFLRSLDFGAKNIRQKEKEIEAVRNLLMERLKREPTEEEIAKELSMSVEELRHLEEKVSFSYILSLEDIFSSYLYRGGFENFIQSREGGVEETVERRELLEKLKEVLGKLGEKELLVLQLSFFEGLKTQHIAHILEVSPGRVTQLKKRALKKLAKEMERYL